jgi:hypothetical protein
MRIEFKGTADGDDGTRNWTFTVSRAPDKNGSWLANYTCTNHADQLIIVGAAAFKLAAPAKRWLEAAVAGERLSWMGTDDGRYMQAHVEKKVDIEAEKPVVAQLVNSDDGAVDISVDVAVHEEVLDELPTA